MLNVQALGILLRALRDGNARPGALRAPGAVAGVARVTPVAADVNESVRGDAALRTLPALRPSLREPSTEPLMSGSADAAEIGAASTDAARPMRDAGAPAHEARSPRGDAARADPRVAPHERSTPAGAPTSAAQAPATQSGTTALALSPVARWLCDVQSRAVLASATPVAAAPPLVADADASAPTLAAALARAFEASGVFYESHLARWVDGRLPLAATASEPQAAWTPAARADQLPGAVASLPQDAQQLAVVARQLETLETKSIVWAGSPWPGQQASIEIREDERAARQGDDRNACAPSWRTRIAMSLPSLGEVDATLALRGNAVELALVVPASVRARLDEARDALASALAAHSLELVRFAAGDRDGG
jgi:hypothetical protein